MDPAALLHPVGPEPVRVYWIRRAVVLVTLLVVVVVLLKLVGGGGGSKVAAKRPPVGATPTATAAPGPTAPASASPGVPACEVALLKLTVKPSAVSYPTGGAVPSFSLMVTQTGSMPCTVDLGAEQLAAVVYKGTVRVWSSADCASATPAIVTLQPAKAHASTLPWGRSRSAPSCPSSTPGGVEDGTYTVRGQLRGLPDVVGGTFTLS